MVRVKAQAMQVRREHLMDADATHVTSCASLDGMLKPKGVVLVGASDRSAFSRTAYAAGIIKRNEGHSSLTVEGTEDMWKTRFEPRWRRDLGDADDPDRSVVGDRRLAPGEKIAACSRGDWYAALVLDGSVEVAGKTLVRDDVLIAERDSAIPEMVGGRDGVQLLEHFRTARAV